MSKQSGATGFVVPDRNGTVWLDGQDEVLHVDGVRLTLDALVAIVNPDPSKYFRAQRDGDNVTVTQYTRGALMADLGMISAERAELDKLAHSLAYVASQTLIESNCTAMGGAMGGLYDLDSADELAASDVEDAVKYLEARGLLQHDEQNPSMVAVRDEREATA